MSNSTHIPWLEFFQQDNWYHDLFITYGGLCVERLPNRTAKLTILLTLTLSLIWRQSNTGVLPCVLNLDMYRQTYTENASLI